MKRNFVLDCVEEYKKFMRIDSFPEFDIVYEEIDLKQALKQGFGMLASAKYDFTTKRHILKVNSIIDSNISIDKYTIFHELTHFIDAEMYSNYDKLIYCKNRAYTEYHAKQVEFMKLLGAKTYDEKISFSINKELDVRGEKKTVQDYLEMTVNLATNLIKRADFPVDMGTLVITFGIIFNYYGIRSICKMSAVDYKEIDTSIIDSFIGIDISRELKNFMLGWFDVGKIKLINEFYFDIIMEYIQKYRLNT